MLEYIIDRTEADVLNETAKGSYNISDVERVYSSLSAKTKAVGCWLYINRQ